MPLRRLSYQQGPRGNEVTRRESMFRILSGQKPVSEPSLGSVAELLAGHDAGASIATAWRDLLPSLSVAYFPGEMTTAALWLADQALDTSRLTLWLMTSAGDRADAAPMGLR